VDAELRRFLAGVPNGATVRFPTKRCYAETTAIKVYDRRDLVIDGGGSTFRKVSTSSPSPRPPPSDSNSHPNWRIAGGSDITLRNMIIRGAYTGVPNPGNQFDPGVSIWGVSGIQLLNLSIYNVDGDFVTADPDLRGRWPGSYGAYPFSRRVTIDHLRGENSARQGVSFTHADGGRVANSYLSGVGLASTTGGGAGVDLEIDAGGERVRNVAVVDNTFGKVGYSAIALVPGGSPNVGNVFIARNKMSVPPAACGPAIYLGDASGTKTGIVVVHNVIVTQGDGIRLDNVAGSIGDNVIVHRARPGLCDDPALAPPYPVPVRRVSAGGVLTGNVSRGFGPAVP
jgi:hypothetical protein